MKTLDEHIKQSENYKAYRGHKAQYDKLYSQYEALEKAAAFGTKRKTQKALDAANEYRENFRMEITLHEAADRYLKGVLNGKTTTVPLGDWQAERARLTAERKGLSQEYYKLKDEVKQVEIIRRDVDTLMREESRERQPIKARGLEH